jgi:polyisoprenoid-binding protein YceI
MKTNLLALAFGSLALTANAQNTSWNLDKTHSSVGFSIEHMVVSEVTGNFNDFSMTAKSDKDDFTDVTGTLTIQTASIDTKDPKRDGHLKAPDFFDAEKNPTITFEIKQFSKVKDKEYKLVGNLTMHGATRSVTLKAKFGGVVKDPYGNMRTGMKITGDIDRYDYNLKYNSTMEAGGLALGKNVSITCNVEFVKAK